MLHVLNPVDLDPTTQVFHHRSLIILREGQVPFLVGGSYALKAYTGDGRQTKDLDIFVRPRDCGRTMKILSASGFVTELVFPHWLAKAFCSENFIDIIFSSGNGVCEVDDTWFVNAVEAEVLGVPVKLCPPEEMIWQQAFIMERERYDGADVAHLLRSFGTTLDWNRLLRHFDNHWRVLLVHLILFGFIYPAQRTQVPKSVLKELLRRLKREMRGRAPEAKLCQGTLLSRTQYLVDLKQRGYDDARLPPRGNMTTDEVELWTAAIQDELPNMPDRPNV